MKKEIIILLVLIISIASGNRLDAEEPSSNQAVNQHVASAFSVFKTGTLKEAKICIARLDAELKKNPNDERLKNLKASIKEVFLADLSIIEANQNKVDAELNIKSKNRNLQIVITPSTLTKSIDQQDVAKAKKELTEANTELGKANNNIALVKKNLTDTIKRNLEKMQPTDREHLEPVFSKIAARHEPPKPKNK
jgi:hypothetical protein